MTNMDDMQPLLAAYADGELDDATMREVEAYIAANPAARQQLSLHRETTALLRTAFSEQRFAQGTTGLRTGVPVNPGRRFRWVRYGWAIAASILMGMVGYGAGAFRPGLLISERDRMLTEIAEYHGIYSRETVHLVEVPASQAEHLKLWLGKRVNVRLVIPDFRAAGLTFVGGRMVVLDGAPVAELMYTRENGLPIAFCVLGRQGRPDPLQVERRGSVNLATWDDGSHAYVVVGEADPATVRSLAALAQRQL